MDLSPSLVALRASMFPDFGPLWNGAKPSVSRLLARGV
jgi:hypothetical protein